MRGEEIQQSELFSYGSLEERIPASHPQRPAYNLVRMPNLQAVSA